MKYLLKDGLLLLRDGTGYHLEKKDILINNSIIEKIGDIDESLVVSAEVINAENKLIMPGLANLHTHAYMTFMKNTADDIPFNTWLFDKILPIEAKIQKKDFYWATMLGCIEMIRTGTTSYLDMHICENECAKAARDSGMRAFLGKCIRDEDIYKSDSDFKKALKEKDLYETDLVKFVLSPHSVYSCTEKSLLQIAVEAEKRNMLLHIHLSESDKEVEECLQRYKKTPVAFLDSIGMLNKNTIAAHCVKVNNDDMGILKNRSVSVVTNPSSNAKLGNGIAPVDKMLENKINVCIGTDSAASNNTLNMFREMNTLALIHKAHNNNPQILSAEKILDCCLTNSAKALNQERKTGIITQGAFADLIFIELKTISVFPNNNIVSSLCYSANGSEVDSVMVNGKFLMKAKQLITIDEERVYFEINRLANKYL